MFLCFAWWGLFQAPVIQKLDSAIHRINHYPLEKYKGNQLRYPVDSVIHLLNNWGQENIYDGTNLFQIPQSISRKNYTHMHGCQ